MKTLTLAMGLALIATFALTGCGESEMERDAKKMATLTLQLEEAQQQLMQTRMGTEAFGNASRRIRELNEQTDALMVEVWRKYQSPEDTKKFQELFTQAKEANK